MKNTSKQIVAVLKGTHTGFAQKFNCTQKFLNLELNYLVDLIETGAAFDCSVLASEELIEEARVRFMEEWGKGGGKLQFDYIGELSIPSVLEYFEIKSLKSLKKCNLCGDIESAQNAREHLESHHPTAKDLDSKDVLAYFQP
jgi:hypothetical protein